MTHTTNFNLSQWEKSDRIQMADFNADNAKLEAALTARNCRFYTASYTGDGKNSRTFTFPAKPVFVAINAGNEMTFMVSGLSTGILVNPASIYTFTLSGWGTTSLTATGSVPTSRNSQYSLFAILEAE